MNKVKISESEKIVTASNSPDKKIDKAILLVATSLSLLLPGELGTVKVNEFKFSKPQRLSEYIYNISVLCLRVMDRDQMAIDLKLKGLFLSIAALNLLSVNTLAAPNPHCPFCPKFGNATIYFNINIK